MAVKKLFISYSHADAALLSVLKTHLRPLERAGLIAPWFDGYLLPGDNIDTSVRQALDSAELIALLVSADFVASEYCYDIEMKSAVQRHEAGAARVVPIIARECQWQSTPFGRLVAVPTDGKPIMSPRWSDKDEAWTIVARGIEAAARAATVGPTRSSSHTHTVKAPQSGVMPLTIPKKVTDRDRDDFKLSAFDHIARRFEDSAGALGGELSGAFRRLDANRFTVAIYRSGKKIAACSIFIGGSSFSANSICYLNNDSGETNSMNNWLGIEEVDGSLVLRPSMTFAREEKNLNPDGAAEFFWSALVGNIR